MHPLPFPPSPIALLPVHQYKGMEGTPQCSLSPDPSLLLGNPVLLAEACSYLFCWVGNCFTWSHCTGSSVALLPACSKIQQLPCFMMAGGIFPSLYVHSGLQCWTGCSVFINTITAQPLPSFFWSVLRVSGCYGDSIREMLEGNKGQKDLYTISEIRSLMVEQIYFCSVKDIVTLCNKQHMTV